MLTKWFRTAFTTKPRPKAKKRLGLEALEGRWCPAGGQLDPTFGGTGSVSLPNATMQSVSGTVVQPDGKIVTVGVAPKNGVAQPVIVRMNADGTLDTTFNGTGKVVLPTSVAGISLRASTSCVALQPDGKILVGLPAGKDNIKVLSWLSTTDPYFAVARFNANGTLDTSFGTNAGYWLANLQSGTSSHESVRKLALLPNGRILVGGHATAADGHIGFAAVRLTSAGQTDTTFGTAGMSVFHTGTTDYTSNTQLGLTVTPAGGVVLASGGWNKTSPAESVADEQQGGAMSRGTFLVACGIIACVFLWAGTAARTQERAAKAPPDPVQQRLQALAESLRFAEESLAKKIDEEVLFRRLADLAEVDKVRYTGPPPHVVKNPTTQGAGNPVILTAYTFLPRKRPAEGKLPLIVLVHGGVHGTFNSGNVNVLRELLAQGYAVLAPDYRGSTGYGKEFWELIDYGGREVEDVFAGRQWMLEAHDEIDPRRVGIMGWSHGGLITLMNLFAHPKEFQVGYAGVPVCDLMARMGYKSQGYRELFSAPYHIGKTAEEDVNEYRRRSPAWNAEKLQTPLLIHTTTNDEDVNVLEVEHLIKALKAAGKAFEHKVYKDAPGGHAFNRLDTKLARESRAEVYRFLARHLSPPNPVR